MSQIFDFFLAPYKDASTFQILLEAFAAIFGILSVWYAKKEKIAVYPTGIVSTAIYVYICYKFVLYGDMLVNIYYTAMSIYGWYMWSKLDDQKDHIKITKSSTTDKLKAFGIFIFTAAFVVFVYRKYNVMPNTLNLTDSISYAFNNLTSGSLEKFRKATPFLDTFTTGIFFAAMWLMANKKIEHWLLWIFGNIISIPLYFVKGLGFTGVQYFVFLVLAIQGFYQWKKSLNNNQLT
ncbi:nicotinamide mononucleotide transporter [Tenacibaculum holothuriorum]|uniref:Nicotinamide riboside transporter PnuC n=1 Tax=Tenacibaculum holothuriorum TaxID=1635173 RepID=A0A1Y2PB59_9FLAO|nr:nicotinamide riboside transporter PnuC [Tenacibaculum holothuriorum]OSY86958.1 nicotinamide mononucleotide transporter [Tenacibaculum holothuriorum]